MTTYSRQEHFKTLQDYTGTISNPVIRKSRTTGGPWFCLLCSGRLVASMVAFRPQRIRREKTSHFDYNCATRYPYHEPLPLRIAPIHALMMFYREAWSFIVKRYMMTTLHTVTGLRPSRLAVYGLPSLAAVTVIVRRKSAVKKQTLDLSLNSGQRRVQRPHCNYCC